MKFNKRTTWLVIRNFQRQLDYCWEHRLSPDQVVKYFGKERARKWCGKWNGYPDIPLIIWWEKRYGDEWIWWRNEEE